MSDADPYTNWLEDYQRQVDDELAKAQPSAIHRAVADFENWWQSEQGAAPEEGEVTFETHTINEELKLSRKEVGMLKEEIDRLKVTPGGQIHKALQERLRTIGEERARLAETQKRLEEENQSLRRFQSQVQGKFADMRVRMSRAQDGYEHEVRRLEDKTGLLKEQLRALGENRQFLQTEFSRQAARLEEIESGLKSASKTKQLIERKKCELEKKIESLEAKLNEKDIDREASLAQLSEARRSAAELQERLVESGETALDRLDSSASALGEGRRRRRGAEDRIAETTQFLEMKIREIRDENKERFGQFRELLDALSRFRYHKGQP
ncbi:MAG: hypothetical protein V3S11_02410 [Elusimicrobiota bacterium]